MKPTVSHQMNHRQLIRQIKTELNGVPNLVAGYLVGSIPKARSDQFSDLDIVIIAQSDLLVKATRQVIKALTKSSGSLVFLREKSWPKLRIKKVDAITSELIQIDLLICELSSPVKIRKPNRKLFGSSSLSKPLLSNSSSKKLSGYKILVHGQGDLPLDLLAALRYSLRGQRGKAIKLIRDLAHHL